MNYKERLSVDQIKGVSGSYYAFVKEYWQSISYEEFHEIFKTGTFEKDEERSHDQTIIFNRKIWFTK